MVMYNTCFMIENRLHIAEQIRNVVDGDPIKTYNAKSGGKRNDAGDNSFNDVYHGIERETSVFLPDNVLHLPFSSQNDGIRFMTRVAASSHTPFEMTAPNNEQMPAHIVHWAITERNGEYGALTYQDLDKLSDDKRNTILSNLGERITKSKLLMDEVLTAQGIGDGSSLVYAVVGFHSKKERERDGRSRGVQSNPTVHFHSVALPRPEEITGKIDPRNLDSDTLLKHVDPFSSAFFSVAQEPVHTLLEEMVNKSSPTGSVESISTEGQPKKSFAFGWKINFSNNYNKATMAEGVDVLLQFLGQMDALWNAGAAVRQNPEDEDARSTVRQYVGERGLRALLRLAKVRSEMDERETEALEESINKRKAESSSDKVEETLIYLKDDILATHPRYTIPGKPSFAFLFDIDKDGILQSMSISPALSEKGIAEKLTGATVRRFESKL